MPIWEITDLNGNSHSVDLSKTSINSIDDVKAEFKKFDEKKKKNSSRPSLKQTQAMQARNRGGY
ncbi:MAG: hypothetical protein CBD51_005520 [Flavobacteriales bacterium TMED191]|nr:MAG: hypothetical protein CBD51_005520 [Flavobacteriales bacterium TMED191]|tara:strand:- start:2186 stop:2377 length:192 start_codon:yes stop_codon:yes gene_type:complete